MKKLLLLLTALILSTTAFADDCSLTIPKSAAPGTQQFCAFNPADIEKAKLSSDEIGKIKIAYNKMVGTCKCDEYDKLKKNAGDSNGICSGARQEVDFVTGGTDNSVIGLKVIEN
jgi:hypothetical protein